MKNSISISYNEIQNGAYLPTTYYNDATFDYFGVEGEIKYYTALKYTQISSEKVHDNTKTDINSSPDMKNEVNWENVRLQPFKIDTANQLPDTVYIRKDKIDLSKNWRGKIILGDYIIGNETSNFS
ncbi:MAG TPA: hypothetical protein DIT04_02480, partial [Dysgonomonas sp.]|nr:hypothetical protein [Dysgonomonas sp.]